MTHSKLLDRLKCEFEVKTTKEQGVRAHSLVHSTSRVKEHVEASGWTRRTDKQLNHSHGSAQTKQQVG
jgi:hypothetical protein